MTQPTACLRCKGTELADASIESAAEMRVVIDSARTTGVSARVCLMCGAIMLTASEVAKLQTGAAHAREVQEFDF
jgi:hypothetical protein